MYAYISVFPVFQSVRLAILVGVAASSASVVRTGRHVTATVASVPLAVPPTDGGLAVC